MTGLHITEMFKPTSCIILESESLKNGVYKLPVMNRSYGEEQQTQTSKSTN